MSIKSLAFNGFFLIGAILFVIFTPKLAKKEIFFNKQKLFQFDGQLNHIADIGLYFAFMLLALTFAIMSIRITKNSLNPAIQPALQSAEKLNGIIKNSIEHFIIFMGIYIYILHNDSFGLKWNSVSLFPFWFLIGRIQLIVSQIIKTLFGQAMDMSIFGKTLTFVYLTLMISQIGGIELIKMI